MNIHVCKFVDVNGTFYRILYTALPISLCITNMPHSQMLHFHHQLSANHVLLCHTFIYSFILLPFPDLSIRLCSYPFYFLFSFNTTKITTCNCPNTYEHQQETTFSSVPLSACKTGNCAEMNFTNRAGKGGVVNWMSANIKQWVTLFSRYANFSNSAE